MPPEQVCGWTLFRGKERKGKEGVFVLVEGCRVVYQFLLPMPAYCSIYN
jgi:hypothetical protein